MEENSPPSFLLTRNLARPLDFFFPPSWEWKLLFSPTDWTFSMNCHLSFPLTMMETIFPFSVSPCGTRTFFPPFPPPVVCIGASVSFFLIDFLSIYPTLSWGMVFFFFSKLEQPIPRAQTTGPGGDPGRGLSYYNDAKTLSIFRGTLPFLSVSIR